MIYERIYRYAILGLVFHAAVRVVPQAPVEKVLAFIFLGFGVYAVWKSGH